MGYFFMENSGFLQQSEMLSNSKNSFRKVLKILAYGQEIIYDIADENFK